MSGLPRELLAKYFGDDRRMIGFFEDQAATVDEASSSASATAETTATMRQATVIVLSSNGEFENERVLRRGPGVRMYDTGTALIVQIATELEPLLKPGDLGDYADDVAAAAGGVAVGGLYRTGSAIKFRVA